MRFFGLSRLLAPAAASAILASCVVVDSHGSQTNLPPPAPMVRGAISGKPQLFAEWYAVSPECASEGMVTVKVVKGPDHGSVKIEQGDGYPNYDKDNVRFACNKVKVPVTKVIYTSEQSYLGSDTVTLEAVGPAGRFFHNDYMINVR